MKLRILATTDLHGFIYPTNYTDINQVSNHSLAHLATLVNELRNNGDLLLLDNGDAFQGTPLMVYAHKHSNEYPNPMAYIFNKLNYDYINLGNHDFNYGPDILNKFIKENKATLLTSNVLDNDLPVGKTHIIEKGGKKIALIGVLTHYIPHWERPEYITNFTFLDAYKHLKSEVEKYRDNVDYIIGLYHGGLERDPLTGNPTEKLTGENQGYEMAHIDGLDILITGHQHRTINTVIDNTLITQTSLKANECVYIELDLESGEKNAELITLSNYTPSMEILDDFEQLQQNVQYWLEQPIGTISESSPSLLVDDVDEARLNKHPLVSFINQIQLDVTGADISSVALFNGAMGFNKQITMRDLVSTYIYPNTLVTKQMSGKAIKEMLELCASFYILNEDGEIIVNPSFIEPKPQQYNYDMIDGLEYTIKAGNEIGQKVIDIKYKGSPLKDSDSLILVTNNYRAAGGGKFDMIADAPIVKEYQEEMVDILLDYLEKNSPVSVKHTNNITIIK